MPKKYYAVKNGRKIGVFDTWDECKEYTAGFSNAIYKSFSTKEDALAFAKNNEQLEFANIEKNTNINETTKKYHNSDDDILDNLDKDSMLAYIDGSYDDSIKYFSYAGIMFYDDTSEDFSFAENDEELISMRNVSGEVKASMYVMQKAIEYKKKKLYLYYDYNGIQMWAQGIWKTNNSLTKSYRKYCIEVYKKLNVEFIKVKSHTNVKYNEYVDKLAKKAIQEIKNQ